MDLHSGSPYWAIKNLLYQEAFPLQGNISTDVIIIGTGITGALVAHELCEAGITCTMVDKRSVAGGSTVASTAQLQYEIDVPLYKLAKDIGNKKAVSAYQASLKSIDHLETVFDKAQIDTEFLRVPTLLLASSRMGLRELKEEYRIRKENKLPVDFLESIDLQHKYQIDRLGALWNDTSAQIDCYKAAVGLIQQHQKKHDLKVYPYTEIIGYKRERSQFVLRTSKGQTIACKYVIIAAGFEAGRFLPKKVMDLLSTYALVSEPMRPEQLWPERCLIWETHHPYFYMRTTADNRIMMGGEDIPYKNAKLRDAKLLQKTKALERKFHKLFKHIPMITDFSWCGTFSSTHDGLPYIGEYKDKKNMFFALGYGGNGITFSMIAAQIICNKIKGKKDPRESIFSFDR